MNRKDPFGEGEVAAQARRRRNLAIALGLVAFIVAVFATTIIRMGQGSGQFSELSSAEARARG